MKTFQNVRGTQSNVTEIELNVDTVYVRSNIERIETEDFTGWQYDETQYTVREYIETIANKNKNLESENEVLNERVTSAENTLLDLLLMGGDL
ncbi:hypothetical protein ACFSY7_15120 [Kurthia populi]|uniref:Uncharacterized protein n=1 Tax=Kurthia populi TaxID=1562132 RepID=A0ABW5Y435_9BACL